MLGAPAAAATGPLGEPDVVILARFASDASGDAALARVGGSRKDLVGATGFERVVVPGPPSAAVARLRGMLGVVHAEVDGRVRISLTPNDPYFLTDPLSGLGQWGLRMAKVDAAWDVKLASPSLTVAVICPARGRPTPVCRSRAAAS